jgi:hypothetical protein
MTTNCPDYLSIYLPASVSKVFLDHKYLTENEMKLFLIWKDFLIVENVKDIFLVIPFQCFFSFQFYQTGLKCEIPVLSKPLQSDKWFTLRNWK